MPQYRVFLQIEQLHRVVQTLIGLGAPIDGEAGTGYLLRPGFFLPPLMFGPTELEALRLGAHWVERQADAVQSVPGAHFFQDAAPLRGTLNRTAGRPFFATFASQFTQDSRRGFD